MENSEDEKYNAVMTLGKKQACIEKNIYCLSGNICLATRVRFYIKQSGDKIGQFTPGSTDQPLLKREVILCTSICYEDAFGDAGIIGLPDAAYLVNVTNDGWFGHS